MEYLLIKNTDKTPIRIVFDFLGLESFRNPTERQLEMLLGICDGYEFFTAISFQEAKKRMSAGDRLYRVDGEEKILICV